MKYTCEITINRPKNEVGKLFGDPENMKFWQKGFQSKEVLSGDAGKVGAKTKLKYELGKRSLTMIETITHRNPPEEFHGIYETKGVRNLQKNFFKEEDGSTKWISESEFNCSGFMKVMAFFMGKSAFKKQSKVYMEDFKSFAEGNPKYGG
ncbi:SRPBCC family protein [Ekhidna sp.]